MSTKLARLSREDIHQNTGTIMELEQKTSRWLSCLAVSTIWFIITFKWIKKKKARKQRWMDNFLTFSWATHKKHSLPVFPVTVNLHLTFEMETNSLATSSLLRQLISSFCFFRRDKQTHAARNPHALCCCLLPLQSAVESSVEMCNGL